MNSPPLSEGLASTAIRDVPIEGRADLPISGGPLFLADLCHQVRTPLNGILGTLELLLQNELTDEAYELARVAYDSALALHRVFEADLTVAMQDPA